MTRSERSPAERRRRCPSVVTLAAALWLSPPASASANPLEDADEAIYAWDVPGAKQALARAPAGPATDLRAGSIALMEGDYATAERLLAAAVAAMSPVDPALGRARAELAAARGAHKLFAPSTVRAIPAGRAVAVVRNEKDAPIARYLAEAMDRARGELEALIGVVPDHPVRFELLDDPLQLAMMTPLTAENVRTTGTVGVTKYRRIMMVTPRVMLYGYDWLDTAIHEYVHYLLTIRTRNRAPVWLQEGMAKLLESRWRDEAIAQLDPHVAWLLHEALTKDNLVTFDEMYPSVAMLPTAERAALAYAQTETMLALLYERRGAAGIAALLDAVADGAPAEDALAAAYGTSFPEFEAQWRATMTVRTADAKPGKLERPRVRESGDGEADDDPSLRGDIFSHLGGGAARQHARLGVLLQLRGHDLAAAEQYAKARRADRKAANDPQLARRLGELLVAQQQYADAVPLLSIAAKAEPDNANVAAAQGRALRMTGRTEASRAALWRALRKNPFIPTLHCDLAVVADDPQWRAEEAALCPGG